MDCTFTYASEIVSMITSAIICVAAAATTAFAWLGLRTWRRQLEFVLAREIMVKCKFIQKQIQNCRDDISFQNNSDPFVPLDQTASELDGLLLQAQVSWGTLLDGPKNRLLECMRDFSRSRRKQIQLRGNQPPPISEVEKKRIDQILSGEADDDFGKKVSAAINAFEQSLKVHLKK